MDYQFGYKANGMSGKVLKALIAEANEKKALNLTETEIEKQADSLSKFCLHTHYNGNTYDENVSDIWALAMRKLDKFDSSKSTNIAGFLALAYKRECISANRKAESRPHIVCESDLICTNESGEVYNPIAFVPDTEDDCESYYITQLYKKKKSEYEYRIIKAVNDNCTDLQIKIFGLLRITDDKERIGKLIGRDSTSVKNALSLIKKKIAPTVRKIEEEMRNELDIDSYNQLCSLVSEKDSWALSDYHKPRKKHIDEEKLCS